MQVLEKREREKNYKNTICIKIKLYIKYVNIN